MTQRRDGPAGAAKLNCQGSPTPPVRGPDTSAILAAPLRTPLFGHHAALRPPHFARPAARAAWVVLAMLLALHAALVAAPGGDFQRIWLMVHFGLFLLWQPFFAAERELEVLLDRAAARDHGGDPLVPRGLDDRDVAAAAAGHPRRQGLHRAHGAARQPLLPRRLHLPARDAAAVGACPRCCWPGQEIPPPIAQLRARASCRSCS